MGPLAVHIANQLASAHARSELSVGELLARCKLDITRSTLQRKLRGQIQWDVDEARTVADVLKVQLDWDAPRPTKSRSTAVATRRRAS